MNQYLKIDEWCIIEENFNPANNKSSESIFSIGNGHMGQRANFEEKYTGSTFQGNYIAGIYYPDKTRVGWWKNGYPEYFAKVLNASNWIGINIKIDDEELDLATCKIEHFRRILNMKEGWLGRELIAVLPNGRKVEINARRFLSMENPELGVVRYGITMLDNKAHITMTPYVDFDVINQDSNYNEKFWDEVFKYADGSDCYVTAKTRKLDFHVCTRTDFRVTSGALDVKPEIENHMREKYAESVFKIEGIPGNEIVLYKYAAIVNSENHPKTELPAVARQLLDKALQAGYDKLLASQIAAWKHKWETSDITIEGDTAAQQAIRFNIFQLNQTYTGDDARLNIGPKGFTGEKYGGSTYWDTEAFCLPFYLFTTDQEVARNLLVYRYKHLQKAIENAAKLGFTDGAALYPMVTMNGEECHNEWEITFEEIHRNGAIAFAIYNYVRATGDVEYLVQHGLEVLLGISRFWAQRITFSKAKNKFVMLGVTGPNEYENNVNNNFYTSYIACWCLKYTRQVVDEVKKANPDHYKFLAEKTHFEPDKEFARWDAIIHNMYFPEDKELGIFLQQEGYMDKEQITVDELNPADRPLNQKWSWDRILRSCFIKQADVLQCLYVFEDQFDIETIRRNFEFYEPRTVHESSLSPCIHAIIASKLGKIDQAYELYLRTARLDIDDYNNEVKEGLHITSMAGTWLSIVEGFGGMRVRNDELMLNPVIPTKWTSYSFEIKFRGNVLKVKVTHQHVEISNQSGKDFTLSVYGKKYVVEKARQLLVDRV